MRVGSSIHVAAPAHAVWEVISDPESYIHFMSGVTRWEVVGEQPQGLGARYRMLLRVGSAEIGGLIEIVEFTEDCDLAWTSVTGVDQRGRWRLRQHDALTHVELRLSYGVAGAGLFGWLSERIAAPTVRGHLRSSLQQLKRQVEHEQLRSHAAARREARAAS
jgi:uncharacterized membrane protein